MLDDRASQLTDADEARAAWYADTAQTRAAAERAAAELTARQAHQPAEPPPVTAKEWLAAHDAEAKAEDPYRKITEEHDFADLVDRRAEDKREVGQDKPLAQSPELDIREETAQEGTAKEITAGSRAADDVRVPTADETAESVRRAQRALQELKNRRAAEARHAEDEAAEDVSRWHAGPESPTIDRDGQRRPINQEGRHEAFVLDASL